jgi:hypothetical protein
MDLMNGTPDETAVASCEIDASAATGGLDQCLFQGETRRWREVSATMFLGATDLHVDEPVVYRSRVAGFGCDWQSCCVRLHHAGQAEGVAVLRTFPGNGGIRDDFALADGDPAFRSARETACTVPRLFRTCAT